MLELPTCHSKLSNPPIGQTVKRDLVLFDFLLCSGQQSKYAVENSMLVE